LDFCKFEMQWSFLQKKIHAPSGFTFNLFDYLFLVHLVELINLEERHSFNLEG
jgi:hypothetical protein